MLLGSWDGGMFLDKRPLCSVRLHRAVERPQHGPQPLAGAQRSEPPPPPGAPRDAEQLSGCQTHPGWDHGVLRVSRSQSSPPAALLNQNVSSASQGMGTAGQTPTGIQSGTQPDLRLLWPNGSARWGCIPMGAWWGCVPMGAIH